MRKLLMMLLGLEIMVKGMAQSSTPTPIDVNSVPAATAKPAQYIYVTESINGKQIWRKITVSSLQSYVGDSLRMEIWQYPVVNVMLSNNSQVLRNKVVRTVDSLIYMIDYKGNSILLGSTGSVGGSQNVVTINGTQTITGKKIFTDTLTASAGIKSNGIIDTKGLNTEGATNKAAATFGGVQKKKWRLITDNTTIDGTDLWLEIQCSTSDITIILPSISASDGWTYDVKRTDNTAYVVKFQRPDGSFIRILNKRAATLRNNGSQWNFD